MLPSLPVFISRAGKQKWLLMINQLTFIGIFHPCSCVLASITTTTTITTMAMSFPSFLFLSRPFCLEEMSQFVKMLKLGSIDRGFKKKKKRKRGTNFQRDWTSCRHLEREIQYRTMCITDLDKLNLVEVCNDGLVLGSSQFPLLPHLPPKTTSSKSCQNRLKNTHFASLV